MSDRLHKISCDFIPNIKKGEIEFKGIYRYFVTDKEVNKRRHSSNGHNNTFINYYLELTDEYGNYKTAIEVTEENYNKYNIGDYFDELVTLKNEKSGYVFLLYKYTGESAEDYVNYLFKIKRIYNRRLIIMFSIFFGIVIVVDILTK